MAVGLRTPATAGTDPPVSDFRSVRLSIESEAETCLPAESESLGRFTAEVRTRPEIRALRTQRTDAPCHARIASKRRGAISRVPGAGRPLARMRREPARRERR